MKNLGIIIVIVLLIALGVVVFMNNGEGDVATGTTDEANNDDRVTEESDLPTALVAQTWVWQEAETVDAGAVTPVEEGAFTLDFAADDTVAAATDCNSWSGDYEASGVGPISIDLTTHTEMACENTQEEEYIALVNSATSFDYNEEGDLVLSLGEEAGTMTFTAEEVSGGDTNSEDESVSPDESVSSEDEQ